MIQLNLTPEEENTLIELVDTCLADLRVEIGKTDDWTYRQMLQDREAVLLRLLATLQRADETPNRMQAPAALERMREPAAEPLGIPIDE